VPSEYGEVAEISLAGYDTAYKWVHAIESLSEHL